MTDWRESDAALVSASLGDKPKIGTSAAKAARFCLDSVVAKATTYKDFQTLSLALALPLFALINPELQLRPGERYSRCECNPAL